ncbi:hypothetical protein [Cupriavidus campinensis]|uniref:Uncharacterized protein n=1 Tax=Cupriavidus campinensis TaxID=151783 RepID=A0ABY3ESS7_9BURK|nr:hypothetical protein [Cupriavidus campinensis]TSP13955.1 hypothetical protein FGG12_05645 [Cupriavidus campinensis]
MPVRRFWLFARNIDRITAMQDMRSLKTVSAAATNEAFEGHMESLVKEVGNVAVKDIDAVADFGELDREGLDELRMMAL